MYYGGFHKGDDTLHFGWTPCRDVFHSSVREKKNKRYLIEGAIHYRAPYETLKKDVHDVESHLKIPRSYIREIKGKDYLEIVPNRFWDKRLQFYTIILKSSVKRKEGCIFQKIMDSYYGYKTPLHTAAFLSGFTNTGRQESYSYYWQGWTVRFHNKRCRFTGEANIHPTIREIYPRIEEYAALNPTHRYIIGMK